MSPTFVQNHIRGLVSVADSQSAVLLYHTDTPSVTSQKLHSLLLSLKSLPTLPQICDVAESLRLLEENAPDGLSSHPESALQSAILDRLVVAIYAEALDIYLAEAIQVETEAEWWADIERSRKRVAYYLLQTLPARLANVLKTILHTLRSQQVAIRPSLFTPASFRRLFPPTGNLRPNLLITALFPHVQHNTYFTYTIPSDNASPPPSASQGTVLTVVNALTVSLTRYLRKSLIMLGLPFDLVRQECRYKREVLEKIRDKKAEVLGALSIMRHSLESALGEDPGPSDGLNSHNYKLETFLHHVFHIVGCEEVEPPRPFENSLERGNGAFYAGLQILANSVLPFLASLHTAHLRDHHLLRPSRLTLLWPRPVLGLPFILYVIRQAYSSRASMAEVAQGSIRTTEGFFRGYILEPLRDVVNTVSTGGEDGIIVRKEGIAADMDSLERMALSLAKEKLHYTSEQLALLSQQIRVGDLTPILRMYEEDIKNPWKSAAVGTLVRSVLIQVQKAKVDIDQTLAGIDKLLRSQELTFAFVGVAPAFAIVYIVGRFVGNLWSIGKGRGRYGGKRRRAGAWYAMRRLERLLIAESVNSGPPVKKRELELDDNRENEDRIGEDLTLEHMGEDEDENSMPVHEPGENDMEYYPSTNNDISASTAGLLLLSVSRLRAFAETCLPAHSQLREGFLQDVGDLEDPKLKRGDKLRIVDRMWRSWGRVLKWGSIVEELK